MKRVWLFHVTVFLSAFLLFQVQPIFSKALLPGFGGSYLVWGACMVFFQGMLLAGYWYAHYVQRRFGVLRYSRVHWVLLTLSFLFFPYNFDKLSEVMPGMPLSLGVSAALAVNVSLPFLCLSTTSLVLQEWLAASDLPERDNPYVLYSASNLGSMLALLSYPFIIEPLMDLRMQGMVWWAGYAVMLLLHFFCAPGKGSVAAVMAEDRKERITRVDRRSMLSWLLLSMSACFLLLSVTNLLTLEIASIPLLWVLPLSLYLLCFVLSFKKQPWRPSWTHRVFSWSVLLAVVLYLMAQLRMTLPPLLLIILHLGVLFFVCLGCSDTLVRSKPANTGGLTSFYLFIALGGFVGSLLVSWVIPVLSRSLVEYPLSMALAVGSIFFASGKKTGRAWSPRLAALSLLSILVVLFAVPLLMARLAPGLYETTPTVLLGAAVLPVTILLLYLFDKPSETVLVLLCIAFFSGVTEQLAAGASRVRKHRNYYGLYSVFDHGRFRYLQHGTTLHGKQYLDPAKHSVPVSYYHRTTPIGSFMSKAVGNYRRIGMVGLGAGAISAFLDKEQEFTVYEIDPDNEDVARDNFTYLDDAEKRGVILKFVFGDGRISLRDTEDGYHDLLILDAFSSGSIPVHLLTLEAMEEYMRVLPDNGLLLFHISSKYFNLHPVIYSSVKQLGMYVSEASNAGMVHDDAELTSWVAVTRSRNVHEMMLRNYYWREPVKEEYRLNRPWTDRYSNVISVMYKK